MDLNNLLKTKRIELGYTLISLAAKTGLSKSQIAAIETNKSMPSLRALKILIIALELTESEMLRILNELFEEVS